jgi:hypothetical protein
MSSSNERYNLIPFANRRTGSDVWLADQLHPVHEANVSIALMCLHFQAGMLHHNSKRISLKYLKYFNVWDTR